MKISDDPNKEYNSIRMAHFYDDARINSKGAIDFASIGLRSLFLVNGGALLALLTFIGNVGVPTAAAQAYYHAFILFGAGLVLALLSTFCSYFTQGVVGLLSTYDADMIYFSQLGVKETAEELKVDADRERRVSTSFRYAAIGSALLSGALFPVGMLLAFSGVVTAG